MARLYEFIAFATTPLGFILVCLVVVYAILHLMYNRLAWYSIAFMIAVGGIGLNTLLAKWEGLQSTRLLPGLQQIRSMNYPITAFLALMVAVAFMQSRRSQWRTTIPIAAVVFMLMKCFVLLREWTYGRDTIIVILGLIIFVSILFMAISLNNRIGESHGIHILYNMIGLGIVLFLFLSLIQYLANPRTVIWAGRFMGLTAHPNFAGVMLAITAPVIAYLVEDSTKRKRWRLVFWLSVSGAFALLLVSTGSRNAVLSVAIGLLAMYRHRLGRSALLAVIITIGVLIVTMFIGDKLEGLAFERVLSTDDAGRFDRWESMISAFVGNPFFGTDQQRGGESSYLVVLARNGIVGGSLMLVFLLVYLQQLFTTYRSYSGLKEYKTIADCYFGVSAAWMTSAFFEGWFTDVIAIPVIIVVLMGVVGQVLSDVARYVSVQRSETSLQKHAMA